MNLIRHLVLLMCCFTSSLFAEGDPLIVGVESFVPPFVMQGANNKIYGFDIAMMESLCKDINRTCRFRLMRFDELLPAVIDKKIDVAISSITITADRSKQVDFTLPYLLSYSRFLTKNPVNKEPFKFESLNNKKIGIEEGTVFADQIKSMGLVNPTLMTYPRIEELLEALNNGKVDYILVDDPTATYWEANSSGAFTRIGKPYLFGFGLGVAVQQGNKILLESLNKGILKYQAGDEYKRNYEKYIASF